VRFALAVRTPLSDQGNEFPVLGTSGVALPASSRPAACEVALQCRLESLRDGMPLLKAAICAGLSHHRLRHFALDFSRMYRIIHSTCGPSLEPLPSTPKLVISGLFLGNRGSIMARAFPPAEAPPGAKPLMRNLTFRDELAHGATLHLTFLF